MSKQKIVVISGGAGFLGSHLCDRFIDQGLKVICIDNLITGDLKNIAHLKKNKNFRFIKKDISSPFKIPGKVDYVMDFASPASPVDYMNFPIETLLVGSYGTKNMLDLAKEKKARFLVASTSEVYGDPEVHPQTEEYWGYVNSVGPRSCYDEAKRFAEAITMAYHRKFGLQTRIVRIFNTYGPRMRIKDGRVVPNFIDQAIHDQPLTVYGDGSQTRSFCYYSDLVDGIIKLLYSDVATPVNIGNPDEFTIKQFAELVISMSGTKSKITFKSLPIDDPKQRRPDISKAKKHLNWEPKVPLKQGLRETLEWFLKHRI